MQITTRRTDRQTHTVRKKQTMNAERERENEKKKNRRENSKSHNFGKTPSMDGSNYLL